MTYEPLISDSYFHIYNCGNNRENIFIEERNYEYFLLLVKKHILPVAEILSYCLLKNHFHLLINTNEDVEDKSISKAFSNCFNAYTKAINKSYKRTGSLFKDRFSRIRVTDENYLRALVIYINNNAVHHGFTTKPSKYKHSSYFALVSDKDTLLNRDFVIGLFEDRANFVHVLSSKQSIDDDLTLE